MRRVVALGLIACGASSVAHTQSTPEPRRDSAARTQAAPDTLPPIPGPPVRQIATAQAISTVRLASVTSVRALADGRVLLNDAQGRRLLLLDSTLQQVTVVLDSVSDESNFYGIRFGGLIAHPGDSTLFVDPNSLAMLVLDGNAQIARVRAVPRAQHAYQLTSSSPTFGIPGFDAQRRLVYRVNAIPAPPTAPPLPGMPYIPNPPDSAFIVALTLDTRVADTIGVIRIPRVVYSARIEPSGSFSINSVPNPLPQTDDWTVMADGTVAFVRGVDYRVEFRASDGTITSGDKLPFPWTRMTDDDKLAFVDSMQAVQIKSARSNFATEMIAWSNLLNKPYPASFEIIEDYVPPPGLPADWILPKGVSFPPSYVAACPPGTTPTAEKPCANSFWAQMYGSGYTPPEPIYRKPTLVRTSDLPDYKPPFSLGAVRADADGNIWVRTNPMRRTPGGLVYDVINREGVLVDRLQLPTGYALVGFAPGKVVFLSNRDAQGPHLSRVVLK